MIKMELIKSKPLIEACPVVAEPCIVVFRHRLFRDHGSLEVADVEALCLLVRVVHHGIHEGRSVGRGHADISLDSVRIVVDDSPADGAAPVMTDEVELAVAAKRIGETDDVVCQVSDGVRLDAFRTGTVRIASLVRGKSFVAFGCQFLQQRDPDERAFREAVEQDDERSVIVESGGTVGVLKAVCFQNVFFHFAAHG